MTQNLPLFQELDWMSLKNAIKYQTILYIYKAINEFASNFAKHLFKLNTSRTIARAGRDRLYVNSHSVSL